MSAPLLVKFLWRGSHRRSPELWLRQFPGSTGVWGQCRFLFDPSVRTYDWVAVYDDLADLDGNSGVEDLACSPSHTLLVTVEPSSIKRYGRRFLAQFGTVLTSQEEFALKHPGIVRSQPALRWFYGAGQSRFLAFDAMTADPPLKKSKILSTVASSKRHGHTLHRRRYEFTQELSKQLPELEVFGHGVRDMDDKAIALDPYKYHVAVENHVAPHHWTEKLADAFLGCCLPFYYGCPNAAEYFPSESFLPIDIFQPDEAAVRIAAAIEQGEYEKRLPSILEARRRVLHDYNLFAVLSKLIEARQAEATLVPGAKLLSRHAMRSASVRNTLEDFADKLQQRLLPRR